MECVYKCNLKGDSDSLVSCWLCDGLAHLKCAGLTGRVLDNISEGKGLRWCCPKCRSVEIDFAKLFRVTKTAFSEIGKELSTLISKFNNYEKLFNDYKCVEDSLLLSKKKKPFTRSTTKKTVIDLSDSNNDPPIPIGTALNTPISSQAPEILVTNATPTSLNAVSDIVNPIPCQNSNVTVSLGPPKGLVVVPPRKTVFISRLSSDTTTNDIQHYIRSKLKIEDFSVYKFNFAKERKISSFKISLNFEIFDQVVDKNFWPSGVVVREFAFRPKVNNNAVSLPRPNVVQKN